MFFFSNFSQANLHSCKPQDSPANHKSVYFDQSQVSLFQPITSQFISTNHRSVYFDQSQVSLFRPITSQFISTNHRSVYSDQSQTIFYLVRWVGVSSVIGQNKLTCDWSK